LVIKGIDAAAIKQLDPQAHHAVGTSAEFTNFFARVPQAQRP